MESQKNRTQKFDPSLDMSDRLLLVMSTHDTFGYVNRQILVETYGITQAQAGALIRDFLHANASRVKWDATHAKYWLDRKATGF
jgi:hypothetical protein